MSCVSCTWRRSGVIGVFCTCVLLLLRVTTMLCTPLWIDAFLPDPRAANHTLLNSSGFLPLSNATSAVNQSNPIFPLLMQSLVSVSVWSVVLIIMIVFFPSCITERETRFPKSLIVIAGVGQASCAVLFNYAISGSRTPPYLQSVLQNVLIPLQIVIRFAILRKRPTLVKSLCAIAVIIAEFMCMLPTIFPGLESEAQHADDGGASGAGAVLWPLCFASSVIPLSIGNTIMELAVKKSMKSNGERIDASRLNIVYYLFWFNGTMFAVFVAFFWVDIIPGFGSSASIEVFGESMWFNLRCLFGGADCPAYVSGLVWAVILANLLVFPAKVLILRFMEGANYLAIVLALRSPIVLLFWTLFAEHPFYWHPHPHLATWLSVAALCVMIPAIIIYNTSKPEVTHRKSVKTLSIQEADKEPLVKERERAQVET